MSSWYDDDETTSAGSDTFGFFGDDAEAGASDLGTDTGAENASEDTSEGQGAIGRFKSNIGKKNFTLLIIMLVGMAIIVIVALVFGSDAGEKPNTNKTQQTQQSQTQQPVQQPTASNSNTDWKDMTGAKFETGAEKTALFTVTDYKMYARSTGGKVAPLEIRVELWGAIAGYDGIYKVDVPYDTLAVIEQLTASKSDPLSFNVTFRVGTYGENKVIYDITP